MLTLDRAQNSTPHALDFYDRALKALIVDGVRFLVGGGYAVHAHTGLRRSVNDFDLFLMRSEIPAARRALERAGFRTEVTYPHWLAKAFCDGDFIDLIFDSGNGRCAVDEVWFEHADHAELLGHSVRVCPPEETIWQKGFIMERERFDGADVAHIIRARWRTLDWRRLLSRFGDDWRVLYSHLCLYGYIYPAHRTDIPLWLMAELAGRITQESWQAAPGAPECNGPRLSRQQYLTDIDEQGYCDTRLIPRGSMSPEQVALWTPRAE